MVTGPENLLKLLLMVSSLRDRSKWLGSTQDENEADLSLQGVSPLRCVDAGGDPLNLTPVLSKFEDGEDARHNDSM